MGHRDGATELRGRWRARAPRYFGPGAWQTSGPDPPGGRALSCSRDPRRLSEEILRGADRTLVVDHRGLSMIVRGEAVQLRHNAVDAQCRIAVCGTPVNFPEYKKIRGAFSS